MKLSYVILADAAETTSNGKFSILGGGVETIFAFAFPTIRPGLAVVARLLASETEAEQEHEFHIELTGPSEYRAPLGGLQFVVLPRVSVSEEAIPLNLIINMQIIAFPEPGAYMLHFFVDNQEIGTAPLTAQQLNPDEITSSLDEK